METTITKAGRIGSGHTDKILTSTPKTIHSQERQHRKTLQTLQQSATGIGLNGGKDWQLHQKDGTEGKQKLASDEVKLVGGLVVSSASGSCSLSDSCDLSYCSRLTQTEDSLLEDLLLEKGQNKAEIEDSGRESGFMDSDAISLLSNNVSDVYWMDLAEERKRALQETLSENEDLHTKIENLVKENEQLRKQNEELRNNASLLSQMLEDVVSDDEGAAVSDHEDDPSPDHLTA